MPGPRPTWESTAEDYAWNPSPVPPRTQPPGLKAILVGSVVMAAATAGLLAVASRGPASPPYSAEAPSPGLTIESEARGSDPVEPELQGHEDHEAVPTDEQRDGLVANAPGWPSFPGEARIGDTGHRVQQWQEILIAGGVISDNPQNRDGYFGPGMQAAVVNLQLSWGWEAPNGIAGNGTYARLVEADPPAGEVLLGFPGEVRLGDTGRTVQQWQEILIAGGVISDNPQNRDGYFGPGMQAAVLNLQLSWGWEGADGVASAGTYTRLDRQLTGSR